MRTSFHHQSEAQPPNGRLTAATSPDTPSAAPASQSVSNASHMTVAQKPRGTARFRTGPAGPRPARSCELRPSATRLPTNACRPKPSRSRRVPTGCRRTRAFYSLTEEKNQRDTSKVESCGKGEVLDAAGSRGELASLLDTVYPFGQLLSLREGHADLSGSVRPRSPCHDSSRSPRRRVRCRRHDAAFNVPALEDRRRRMRLKSRAVNASSSMTKTIGFHGAGEPCGDFERPVTTYPLDAMAE
jgi:hypothetical protein